MPKRTKYRKQMKGRNRGYAYRGAEFSFGEYALKAVEAGRVNSRQIEAARIALTRFVKRQGKTWIRVFPDKPLTKKPLETRMGKGKGSIEFWVARVKPGRILFEVEGIDEETARSAFALGAAKLPIKTKFIKKLNSEQGA